MTQEFHNSRVVEFSTLYSVVTDQRIQLQEKDAKILRLTQDLAAAEAALVAAQNGMLPKMEKSAQHAKFGTLYVV